MPRAISCRTTQFLCCNLRVGTVVVSTLAFVNAVFLFAGEAALFSGLASAVLEQASGKLVPPGTRLDDYPDARGLLTGIAVFFLLLAICGWAAAARKSLRLVSAYFLLCLVDTVSCCALVVVLSFFATDVRYALAHIPLLVMSIYTSICANNFRLQVKGAALAAAAAGGRRGGSRPPRTQGAAPSRPEGFAAVPSTATSGHTTDLDVTAEDIELALSTADVARPVASTQQKQRGGSAAVEDGDDGVDTDEELAEGLSLRSSGGAAGSRAGPAAGAVRPPPVAVKSPSARAQPK